MVLSWKRRRGYLGPGQSCVPSIPVGLSWTLSTQTFPFLSFLLLGLLAVVDIRPLSYRASPGGTRQGAPHSVPGPAPLPGSRLHLEASLHLLAHLPWLESVCAGSGEVASTATLSAVPRTSPGPRGRLLKGQVGSRRRRTTSPTIWLSRAMRGKAGICPFLAGAQNRVVSKGGCSLCP